MTEFTERELEVARHWLLAYGDGKTSVEQVALGLRNYRIRKAKAKRVAPLIRGAMRALAQTKLPKPKPRLVPLS